MFNWIKDNPIFFVLIFLAIVAPSLFLGAMRLFFYIILGVVVLLLILGVIFRVKIRRLQDQMQDNMNNMGGGHTQAGGYGQYSRNTNSQSEEGDVKIFKQRGVGDKKVSGDVGDYVEFEEVEEK